MKHHLQKQEQNFEIHHIVLSSQSAPLRVFIMKGPTGGGHNSLPSILSVGGRNFMSMSPQHRIPADFTSFCVFLVEIIKSVGVKGEQEGRLEVMRGTC